MSRSAIEVAILGGGNMGKNVIQHLADSPLVSGITVFDRHPEKINQLVERYGVKASETLEQGIGEPCSEACFCHRLNNAHKELSIAALNAGKAVMCEKPMATNLADAEEMVRAAKRTKGFLQVGFELRYSHLYTTVKDWIDRGLLGRVLNTQCVYISSAWGRHDVWRADPRQSGGMFGEKLSHYVDLTRWWIGDSVTDVYATSAPNVISYYQVHDNYHCIYRFGNGAVSQLTFMMAPAATFHGDPLQNAVSQQAGDGHALRYMIYGDKKALPQTDVFHRTIKRWQFGENDYGQTSQWVQTETLETWKTISPIFTTLAEQAIDIVRRVVEGDAPKNSAARCVGNHATVFCRRAFCVRRTKRPSKRTK